MNQKLIHFLLSKLKEYMENDNFNPGNLIKFITDGEQHEYTVPHSKKEKEYYEIKIDSFSKIFPVLIASCWSKKMENHRCQYAIPLEKIIEE